MQFNLFVPKTPPIQRKNHDDNRTRRESTVSFAILSQNFLTLVNWEIFQISPTTVNKAINKAKGKINNYNRNWWRGGCISIVFSTPPPRLVCTTFDGPNRLIYRFILAVFRVTHPYLKWKIEHAKQQNSVGSIRIKTIIARVTPL